MVAPAGLAARNSSTSMRWGDPKAPPKRVHLSAAVADANRMACSSAMPSAIPSANAPWKASPAPSVSTV